MATNPRPHNKKPKGWRLIVVDNVDYWWIVSGSSPIIKRVSDRKKVMTWNYFVAKGWYEGMEKGDIRWTPKLVADTIRELYKA
jgi:hypothetical protein